MKKKITCIICPIGCEIYAETKNKKDLSVTGNKCKKGELFAEKELTDPRRILTTTTSIDSEKLKRLPVRSSKPVPKDMILEMVLNIKKIKIKPSVRRGDIICKNFMNTGSNIIASRTVVK